MKLTLFALLGLIAFASATSQKLDLFAEVPQIELVQLTDLVPQGFSFPEKVREAVQNALDQFNALIQKFKDQSAINREKINEIAAKLKARAEASIKEATDKIKELAQQGGRVGKCAVKYNDELVEISTKVIDGLKECSTEIVAALKELTTALLGYSAEFVESVNNLKALVMKCYNEESKTAIAKCVLKNVTEFTKLFGELLDSTKAVITGVYEKGQDLVNAAKSCNDKHIQTTLENVKAVKAQIEECVKMQQ